MSANVGGGRSLARNRSCAQTIGMKSSEQLGAGNPYVNMNKGDSLR